MNSRMRNMLSITSWQKYTNINTCISILGLTLETRKLPECTQLNFLCFFLLQKEKKILETKRLDLDSCKSRLRKAKQVASQTQVCVFSYFRNLMFVRVCSLVSRHFYNMHIVKKLENLFFFNVKHNDTCLHNRNASVLFQSDCACLHKTFNMFC